MNAGPPADELNSIVEVTLVIVAVGSTMSPILSSRKSLQAMTLWMATLGIISSPRDASGIFGAIVIIAVNALVPIVALGIRFTVKRKTQVLVTGDLQII